MCKNDKNKHQSKNHFNDSIKKCANLKAKVLTATYKSKVVNFKLYKDPLQHQVYFLSFINSLKCVLYKFNETCILLMDYPSIRRGYLPDDAKILHVILYIHTWIRIIIDY